MSNITSIQLRKIHPQADITFLPMLNEQLPLFGITSRLQVAAFLAEALHESSGFTHLRESLAYSPQRLIEIFPKRINDLNAAKALVVKGQVAIGDLIYGGRYGNGINNGDGYKYRGGGIGGLTFHDNYLTIGQKIEMDLVNHPELITTPEGAIKSFCQWWVDNRCNDLLAAGLATPVAYDGIDRVSMKVNGARKITGVNGWQERRRLFDKAKQVIT